MNGESGECEAVDLLYSLIDSIVTSAQSNMIDARSVFYVIYVRYKSRHFNLREYKFMDKNLNFFFQ